MHNCEIWFFLMVPTASTLWVSFFSTKIISSADQVFLRFNPHKSIPHTCYDRLLQLCWMYARSMDMTFK
ncbi:hypothetical protein K443DRAFT_172404 [Laccaria amethystina LaAM-08-1]|uniref:Uncharacterized protein n=1 Tax=Laccaria amethystina LaAM-08-1 TaxID=1095629 RepID=A0A0C9XU39_9AGAR|nr:hypothetical protein K443DRAFT_172404 [Laccaria amethystina LaAM-08-1]